MLVGYAASSGSFKCLPEAIIYKNEIFELLGDSGKSLHEVMADPVDYRERLRASKDEAVRDPCVRKVGMRRLSATATKNLNSTYQALFA